MKKLVVLAMLLVAGMLWAQVTLTGEVETKWYNDFNAKNFYQGPEVIIGVNAKIDDNNSLYIEIEEGPRPELLAKVGPQANLDPDNIFPFDKAYFTVDLGKVFKLPVGLTWRTGFDEYDPYDGVKVSWGEWEDVIGSDLHTWGEEFNITKDMVQARVAWGNDFSYKEFLAGVAVKYDPVWVEVSYVNYGSEDFGKGDIEAGVEVNYAVSKELMVGAAFDMDFDLEETGTTYGHQGDSEYTLGAGLCVNYNKMVSLGIGWQGVQDYIAGGVQVDLWAQPVADKPLQLWAAVGLGLDEDVYSESFDSFEASLSYVFGKATTYFGVFWAAEDGGTGIKTTNPIAREKMDFITAVPYDQMAIFMRAELKY